MLGYASRLIADRGGAVAPTIALSLIALIAVFLYAGAGWVRPRFLPAITALTASSVPSYYRLKPHNWSSSYTWLADRDREAVEGVGRFDREIGAEGERHAVRQHAPPGIGPA